VRRKNFCHIRQPARVLANGWVRDFELLIDWMESDSNWHGLVLISQYLAPEKGSHEGCDALLAVNQNPFSGRGRPVLEFDRWVPPSDEVADRIAAVEGVQQVSDFG